MNHPARNQQEIGDCSCPSSCGGGIERREFIKTVALSAAATLGPALPVMAGPFEASEFEKMIPAEKKLDSAWVVSLFARGKPTVYRGQELERIGMPVGGLCAGQVYLGGDGKLWYWDIFNHHVRTGDAHYAGPMKPSALFEQGFALKMGDKTLALDRTGFSDISFRGEYPLGRVEYRGNGVRVSLEAFSPFVPLNTDDSSLPATVMRFTVENTSTATLDATLVGTLENAVCRSTECVRRNRNIAGTNFTFLECSAENSNEPAASKRTDKPTLSHRSRPVDKLEELPDFGTMGLALLGAPAEVAEHGALGRKLVLGPGRSSTVTFVLTWHFPNLRIDKLPGGRHYATKFDSALAVAGYIAKNFERLDRETRLWRDTWYDSTLPYWFLDRTMINTSILATSTCYRFANGRFYAWEGVGCCQGTCTSVWYYAQAMARLFPDLERSVREMQDFADGIGFSPATGGIWTRAEARGGFVLDGQAGNVLRAYREHQMSSDNAFLKRNWTKIKKALQWLVQQDGNGDGIIDGKQSTTLDTGLWWGAMSWTSSLYLAALRAGEEMAREMGDDEFARSVRAPIEAGAKNLVDRLWNGEYFIHTPDRSHPNSFIIGNGCHIDQVYGQAWADQVGLGRILPAKYTRSALRSIWKYNFTPDVGPFRRKFKEGRWFALAGEGGTIMTTWPRGDREYPKVIAGDMATGVGYLNECMSGFEHQVAGHMIGEGLVLEGVAIERAIHDRYHASRRNPWNEIECGDHYSRAMASYGVFLAACGFEYHGPKGHIGFAPRLAPENFKAAFTGAEGWGTFTQNDDGGGRKATIEVKWGKLCVRTLALLLQGQKTSHTVTVTVNGKVIEAKYAVDGSRVMITMPTEIRLNANEKLEAVIA